MTEQGKTDPRVSAGAVDKVIDLAFNPSRDKIREMTMIDRVQARYFPLLDVLNLGREYCMNIAAYRENPTAYKKNHKKEPKPLIPNLLEELIFRTAQWQKSIAGKNLEKATDIALAEIETKIDNDNDLLGGKDPWKE